MADRFTELHTWGTANIDKYTDKFNFNRLLDLYANWRRALDGPIATPRPTENNGKELLKWDVWKSLDDKDPDDCKADYIDLIENMNAELLRMDPTLTFTNE